MNELEIEGLRAAKAEVIESARVAVRYLPPPSFMRDSKGWAATKRLVNAMKELRAMERRAASREDG